MAAIPQSIQLVKIHIRLLGGEEIVATSDAPALKIGHLTIFPAGKVSFIELPMQGKKVKLPIKPYYRKVLNNQLHIFTEEAS